MLCWRSFWRVATSTLTIFPITMANTSIMGKCHCTALGSHTMQHPKLLTLYWHSVDAVLTLCWRSVDALLTLCWRSVDALLTLCWRSVDALLTLCWRSVDALLTLCWRSVDALLTLCWRSFSGAVTSTLMLLPIQVANTLIMDKCRSTALGLYKMQHPNSSTLCWRSFSEWGCDHVAFPFANEGCQYLGYEWQRVNRFPINSLKWRKIVYAPLTLIFRMWLSLSRYLFCLWWLPIHWLWITASKSLPS